MSVLKVDGGGGEIRLGDGDRVSAGCGGERNGIASARLAHSLRIYRRGAVLANQTAAGLIETDRTADVAGIHHRGHVAVGLAIEQKAHFRPIDTHGEAIY